MTSVSVCRECKEELVVGQNWQLPYAKTHNNICIGCHKIQATERRRNAGKKPRPEGWGRKYGVPSKLPNGSWNPEYQRLRYYAHGGAPRKPSRFGVPYNSPEYSKLRRREKGIGPRVRGDNKVGIPSILPDGADNPEYKKTYYKLFGGHEPRPIDWGHKYGVPTRLPDGTRNLEYDKAIQRTKGVPPRKPAGQNKFGVPSNLPDGRRNPEYQCRWGNSPEAKERRKISQHRRRRHLSTTVILGKWFEGAELHHMTPCIAIYIPKSLHRSIWHNIWTGKNMDKINALAMEWYERCGGAIIKI